AALARDQDLMLQRMVEGGFLRADSGIDAAVIYDWMSKPYAPYVEDRFTFDRDWLREMLSDIVNISGERADAIKHLNMPPSYVILDRVVWGMAALLARLGASGPFRAILAEYREGAPPATELGRQEAAWRASRASA
ncbi:MAG TPA: hypothetical protein VFV66_16665, partial [Nonomuraea sp.]|nr:hypothetical protein [Nonomuraea sp.]